VALTGAGISTESGIPDYRGPETRRRARNPVRYNAFLDNEAARRRYWARSFLGWPKIRDAKPNAAHRTLSSLEAAGLCLGVITQNVDRLHEKAGSKSVVELHGGLHRVRCLSCHRMEDREALQGRIFDANPRWNATIEDVAPDGDVEISREMEEGFSAPGCLHCQGPLKPDVVFFGENVHKATLQSAWDLFDHAEAILVVGSSLEVYSGRRFVLEAKKRSMDIVVVNVGKTRAHDDVTLHLEGRAGELLPELENGLMSES
jgi:NAD-dependent SIR2 family protein deacetylase